MSRPGAAPIDAGSVSAEAASAVYADLFAAARTARAADYVALDEATTLEGEPLVRVVAFYLPQYHPIPENDAWWGRGFTEWTNVSKAVPQFRGHDQPRLPGELGFYDLRVPEVQRRQVALARQFGISAFCFYYYWFNGRRLLERPLEQFMADPAIDFPFCICWANENWTRRWDGHEDQILIGQQHHPDRDAAFMADIEPALRHEHYLRIDGRPVVLVYRPGLMREPATTVSLWRHHCRQAGLPDPYFVAAEAFETVDPRSIGFDAAVEFPPNTAGRPLPPEVTGEQSLVHQNYGGRIYRYSDMWRWRVERHTAAYPLFRAVCPGFDNEARRPGAGSTFVGSSAAAYGRWLASACRATLAEPDRERRLVFVNAWNEWAEAAYLEPDRRHGYAGLDATAKALNGLRADWTLLVVSHDACRGGAQLVLLQTLAWLRRHTGVRCVVLCLAGGEWLPRFEALAETVLLADLEARAASAGESDITSQVLDVCGGRPALIYANSVASGRVFGALAGVGAPIVAHVHELESSIARYAADWIHDVVALSAHVIACSEPVRQNLVARHGVASQAVTTVPESIGPRPALAPLDAGGRAAGRRELALSRDDRIVVGCGIGMPFRKGADLFLEVGQRLHQRGVRGVQLVWVGAFPGDEQDADHGRWTDHLARAAAAGAPVTIVGVQDEVAPYLQVADVFLLPSREDPFPLVVLEAAACGVPAICFEGAGGMPEFVADAGVVVPFADVEAMTDALLALLADEPRRVALGDRARSKVAARFTTDATAPQILATCRAMAGRPPAVSVVVPNYNHARYLSERLSSVFGQTFRDIEVIILDDASTDGSLEAIAPYRDRADVRVVVNDHNSGSTFAQWLKGIDAARADIIWIAESDDGCEPELVETLLGLLRDPQVKLAYANSLVWNEQSEAQGDYTQTAYLTSLSATKWRNPYRVPAAQEVNDGLGVKNTILSASAVLFKKFDVPEALRRQLMTMQIAGDWLFFAHAMAGGEVAYTPRTLNRHRRHDESVVGKLLKQQRVEQFFREFHEVQRWIHGHYALHDGFEAKWEQYLHDQWRDFFPDRPFEDLSRYYPIDEARARIAASRAKAATYGSALSRPPT